MHLDDVVLIEPGPASRGMARGTTAMAFLSSVSASSAGVMPTLSGSARNTALAMNSNTIPLPTRKDARLVPMVFSRVSPDNDAEISTTRTVRGVMLAMCRCSSVV